MANFTQKREFQQLIHVAYGIGAALVIIGALFKLQHWTGAGVMLTIGMMTEFIIFILSAFEAMPKKYDWEKVYPELYGEQTPGYATDRLPNNMKVGIGMPLDLGINPAQIDDIKEGIGKLNSSINNLNSLATVAEESQKLTSNLINANQAVGAVTSTSATLSNAYQSTAQIIANLNHESAKGIENIKNISETYNEQVAKLAQNMSAINSSFELQLKDNQQYQQTYNAISKEINALLSEVKKTSESSTSMTSQMTMLNDNVAKLNSVYGNMLTAITKIR